MTRSTSEILEGIAEGILASHAGAQVMRPEELVAAAALELEASVVGEFLGSLHPDERLDLLSVSILERSDKATSGTLARLLPRLLVAISADDLLTVRDALRALLVDYVPVVIRRRLPAAILTVSCSGNREPTGGEVPSTCIPWTARAARIEEELD